MSKTDKVFEIMLDAFKEIAEQNSEIEIKKYDDNLILFGAGATIDSLTLVSLIVDLESKISEEFSCEISLTDDRAMTREISPFDTFGSLKSYIEELVSEIK
jgi:acyl carrier protein